MKTSITLRAYHKLMSQVLRVKDKCRQIVKQ